MLRYLEVLHRTGSLVGLTDWELLDRFQEARRTGDRPGTQAAFEAIVERHGAMVWHICRSLATDEHDAEDAFQATYLILARKADGLRLRSTLAGWLHAVARRTALRARVAAGRRRSVEQAAASRRREAEESAGPASAMESDEIAALIHAEIGGLPAPFRAVIVLCDLEGLSYLEAARHLKLPLGTVQSRLARARRRLRRGLAGFGLNPASSPAPWDAPRGSIFGVSGTFGLSRSLAERTCRFIVLVASDPAAGTRTVVSASVQSLIEGGSRLMLPAKSGSAMTVGLIGLLLCAVMVHAQARPAPPLQDRSAQRGGDDPARTERRVVKPPAPRELNVAGGRGEAPVYVLEKSGRRRPAEHGARPGLVMEEVRELHWAVVTALVDNRQVQEWFLHHGRTQPPGSGNSFRRAELERQTLQKDGAWSPWEPIDLEAKLAILENLPEWDEELTPDDVRLMELADPLPFLKVGLWEKVHIAQLVPKVKTKDVTQADILKRDDERIGGMMRGRTARPWADLGPPLLLLRQFDFNVEPGRTYRYRARVVLNDHRRRADEPGAWSGATEPVTIP